MPIIGEDLRNGQPAPGFLDHRPSQFGIPRHVDFLENYAFPVEQSFRLYAVGTILRRVHDDLSHTSDSKPHLVSRFRNSLHLYIALLANFGTTTLGHISLEPALTTRARVRASTRAAPARFRARAQALSVAPVVNTSSTKRMLRPAKCAVFPGCTPKAPRTLRRRAFAEAICPWLGVARLRVRSIGSWVRLERRARPFANIAAWL